MSDTPLTIRAVTARRIIVPMERPMRTAMGEIPSAPLVLIDIVSNEGIIGRSYVFGYTPLVLAPLARLVEAIGKEIEGRPIVPVDRMRDFDRRFRLLGWQGLVGMAIGGLDMAFWDAHAKAANMPLVTLLGGTPKPIMAYDSYGVVDPKADEKMIGRSLERGFRGLKIKLGDGDLRRDVETVAAIRRQIGPEIALMIDYNQSLDPVEACRRLDQLAEFDIHWVEEPVAAEDLAGHAQVRARCSIPVQTGENWWFPRDMAKAITAGASDYAMLDVMKIGGVTGWLSAMGQAEAASMPVSSHLFIEASAHLLAVTPTAHWLERLDVASAILREPAEIVDGKIAARGPGLGIDWDEKAVARYAQP